MNGPRRLTARLFVLLGLLAPTLALSEDKPRVLVDLSHEFTFRYDIFGFGTTAYWSSPSTIDKTSSFASIDATTLDGNDVLVISQVATPIPFTPAEVDLVKAWVGQGGGLFLGGRPRQYAATGNTEPYPLRVLAEAFGISFATTTRTGGFQVLPHEVTAGVTGLVADEGSKDNLLQLVAAGWDVLVTGAANEPVIAARRWGSGRVVVSAEDSIISNPYQNPSVSNVALVRNIVSWLAQPRRGNRAWSVAYRILPEKKLTVGGIDLLYPEALSGAPGLAFMRDRLGAIIDALQTGVLGVGLAASQRFVALAGCGGGYSSGTEIGVAVSCPAEDVFLVTAHELTHSFDVTGGTHPESFHGWPSIAAIRSARRPGFGGAFQAKGDAELASRVSSFRAYEAAHGANTLDISEVDRGIGSNAWAIGGKLSTLIEGLESVYGTDVMQRFYRVKRHYGSGSHTLEAMVRWLSLAAGSDLHPYFVAAGTSLASHPKVLPVVYETSPASTDPVVGTPLPSPSSLVVGAPIKVDFSTDMDAGSVSASTVSVTSDLRGALSLTVRALDSRTFEIVPAAALVTPEVVTIRLKSSIVDRGGQPLDGNGNGIENGAADDYVFSARVSAAPPPPACEPGPTSLCIDGTAAGDRRFRVEVDWSTTQGGGRSGKGAAVSTAPIGFSRGGIFWFFDATNPEMLVKVVNGCGVNSRFWVFVSAGTNVGLNVKVTDVKAGVTRYYSNPDLTAAVPVQDTSAFGCD